MSFQKLHDGVGHIQRGVHWNSFPHELIRYPGSFDDPDLPGVIHVTVTLRSVSVGTEINIEQTGVPAVIPPEACYLGWQQSLPQLAQLVDQKSPSKRQFEHWRWEQSGAPSLLHTKVAALGGKPFTCRRAYTRSEGGSVRLISMSANVYVRAQFGARNCKASLGVEGQPVFLSLEKGGDGVGRILRS